MSKFFINRPIVALVIPILMGIVGAVTITTLPVAQFPNIVPPEIQLQASFVGADAQTLEQSVATPIEQQINGVDNMNYMYSLNATGNSQTTIPPDVVNAVQAQNTVNPAGKVGGQPAPANQQFTYSVLAQGRLTSPEQFENVIVREAPDGGTVRVKDVARVELGAQDYSIVSRLNGKPAIVIPVYQLPGSNAVQTAAGVRKLMVEMKQRFPQDMDYAISLDQTSAVTEGIKEIVVTLLIAILLVILVVYRFLQDWRATLIPMLSVSAYVVGKLYLFL